MARQPDLVGLTALAILSVRSSHPYELHRFLIDTHKDYVTGLPRSLYHAMDRLAKDGLIAPVRTEREGGRPERTTYEITDEGRKELAARLNRLLERPDSDRRTLVAAISLVAALPADTALKALRSRAAALQGMTAGIEAQQEAAVANGLPDLFALELDCEHALYQAELAWVRTIIDRIERGELQWPGTVAHALLDEMPNDRQD